MITCAQCGQPLQPAMANCPNCGAPSPLAAQAAPFAGTGMGDQGMPEWMRSIQAPQGPDGPARNGWGGAAPNGAQGAMPAQGQQNSGPPQGMFSVGQLISEDALPDWVRNADSANDISPGAPDPANGWGPPAPGALSTEWPAQGQIALPQGGAAALFDDAALPDWLRAAADRQPANGHLPPSTPTGAPAGAPYGGALEGVFGQPPAPTYSAFPGAPAPGQPYQEPTAGGMSAQSLLDAAALPTWLGGDGQGPTAAANAGPLGGGGLSANSLVDESALPEWMRQEPGKPAADAMPAAGTVSQWLAGPVTDEPLPGFLDQVYASADVPRLEPASPWGTTVSPGQEVRMGAMGAAQLVDPNALPEWLRGAAPGQAAFPAQPAPFGAPPPPPPAMPGNGGYAFSAAPPPPPPPPGARPLFSAADLIEPDALLALAPDEPAPASAAVFSPTSGWSFGEQARAPQGANGNGNGNGNGGGAYGAPLWNAAGGNSAASLVDHSNLPEWLAPNGPPMQHDGSAGGVPANGGGHGPRGARGPIPEAELPDWLRGTASASGASPASVGAAPAGYSPPPDGAYRAQGAYGTGAPDATAAPAANGYGDYRDDGEYGDYASAGPADAGDYAGDYADQYTDRFGVEMPGGAGQFGYEYDYGAASQVDGTPNHSADGARDKKRKRRGFFRRR